MLDYSTDDGWLVNATIGEEDFISVLEHFFIGFLGKLLTCQFALNWSTQLVVPEPEHDSGAVAPGEGF